MPLVSMTLTRPKETCTGWPAHAWLSASHEVQWRKKAKSFATPLQIVKSFELCWLFAKFLSFIPSSSPLKKSHHALQIQLITQHFQPWISQNTPPANCKVSSPCPMNTPHKYCTNAASFRFSALANALSTQGIQVPHAEKPASSMLFFIQFYCAYILN